MTQTFRQIFDEIEDRRNDLVIRLLVKGCTDEQYIQVATNGLRIAGYIGEVRELRKIRGGMAVVFKNTAKVAA